MYVYAHYWKIGANQIELAIIAPRASRLEHISGPHCFNDGGENIKLWMLPFDFTSDGKPPNGIFVNNGNDGVDHAVIDNDCLVKTMLSWYKSAWPT
jgi:hypothetical protein